MQLTLTRVEEIDGMVRRLATYQHDPALKDTWTSYAKSVLSNRRFKGDCDDWASTALHLLVHFGAPQDRLYRALVSSTGEAIDHFIGIVELDNGQLWTVGDTFGPPKRVMGERAGPHKLIETSKLTEKLRWRRVVQGSMQRETTAAAMGAKTTPAGQAFMRSHEKFVAIPYDDFRPRYVLKPGDKIQGTLTVGYGHTGPDVSVGRKISKAEGDALFARDLDRFERAVRRMVHVELEPYQFDALVSFAFNCGEANLKSSTLLKKVNAGAPDHEVQAQFRRWTRSKGIVLAGLVTRRNAEAAMWAGEVVTHGAIAAMFRAPDISPDRVVQEDKSGAKSPDTWLAGGGIATGGVTIWSAVQDAVRDFRDTIYDSELTLLLSVCGVVMAIIGAVLLVKRLREIGSARR